MFEEKEEKSCALNERGLGAELGLGAKGEIVEAKPRSRIKCSRINSR